MQYIIRLNRDALGRWRSKKTSDVILKPLVVVVDHPKAGRDGQWNQTQHGRCTSLWSLHYSRPAILCRDRACEGNSLSFRACSEAVIHCASLSVP